MLYVDLQKSLAEFTLEVQLSVGNEILVLFGPSGSGKTTILKMIAGLLRPDTKCPWSGHRTPPTGAKK